MWQNMNAVTRISCRANTKDMLSINEKVNDGSFRLISESSGESR